jgi:pimeloyl-ACP methyl ester carboxylesterase
MASNTPMTREAAVHDQVGLTCAIGIGRNKHQAKIAARFAKNDSTGIATLTDQTWMPVMGRALDVAPMCRTSAYHRRVPDGRYRQTVRLGTGLTVPYVAQGDRSGVPVVLLHAWGESLGSFDRLLPLLPATIHAVAMDQRGHGAADKPADGYTLVDLADDVVAFLDAVGLPSAVLLGSSSGGYLAQQVAVRAPDRVTGLVLVGSPRSLRGRPPFADEVDQLTDPSTAPG